jgi:hypothetical protein
MKKLLLFAITAVVLSAAVPVNRIIQVPPPCGTCVR